MQAIILAGLYVLASLAWPALAFAQEPPTAAIRRLIEHEAKRQNISSHVALAFADDESGLKNIVGDMHRPDPLKRAYGPFQLQARFHLLAGEQPRKLLRLEVNVARGVAAIKLALDRAKGDVISARLMYVCGRKFQIACSTKRRKEILESWAVVWNRWRPRALTVSTPSVLCGTLRATSSRGDSRWQQRRRQRRPSSAR